MSWPSWATLACGLALATGCVRTTEPPPGPPLIAPPPSPAPVAAGPTSALLSFRENLQHATEDAERAGWVVQQIVELPGHHAALVLYRPTAATASAARLARVDAVGSGDYRVLSVQSGMIDVVRAASGRLTWDLRGDRSESVVLHLTPCGASCGIAQPRVLELRQDQFVAPEAAPSCPTCIRDDDRDGVPEFELRLLELRIAPCSRASCGPSVALLAEVKGLESWDGQRYSRVLPSFERLYLERLKRSRADAQRVRAASGKSKVCPLDALRVAAELFVYSRLIGESKPDALRQADEVMQGYGTEPCRTEFDLLGPPRPWVELRRELEAAALPELAPRPAPNPPAPRAIRGSSIESKEALR